MKQTAPDQAIERLAAELMSLSDDQWSRITERWRSGMGWPAAFGPAWDEISERLSDIDWRAVAAIGADEAQDDAPSPATVRPRDQA